MPLVVVGTPPAAMGLDGAPLLDGQRRGSDVQAPLPPSPGCCARCCACCPCSCRSVIVAGGLAIFLGAIPALIIAAIASRRTPADPLVLDVCSAAHRAEFPGEACLAAESVTFGVLMLVLSVVFNAEALAATSTNRYVNRFFEVVPSLLLCYFVPGAMATANVFSSESSVPPLPPPPLAPLHHPPPPTLTSAARQQIPDIAQNVVLPACLVLLTLSIDLPGVMKLGPLAVGMFLAATASIVCGGPLTVLLFRLIWGDRCAEARIRTRPFLPI